jgi:hypothetical protein
VATNISYSLIIKEETVEIVNEADAEHETAMAAAHGEVERKKAEDN